MEHPQTQALVATLKRQLKAAGKTYRDVAELLELSEASIKRLFRDGDLSLPRLERICAAIDLDLGELVQRMSRERQSLSELHREQERELVDDAGLLLVAICCVNGYTFSDIIEQYRIAETTLIQKLARLDRMKLIDLLPGNRIKLRVAPNFNWIAGGPIQQFFHERIKQEFFQTRFDKTSDKLLVGNGLLTAAGNVELQRRMQRLLNEFTDTCRQDAGQPLSQRHGHTIVLALRQWHSSVFREFEKV